MTHTMDYQGQKILLLLWDTAGQEVRLLDCSIARPPLLTLSLSLSLSLSHATNAGLRSSQAAELSGIRRCTFMLFADERYLVRGHI